MSETRNPRNDAGTLASVTLSPCPERKLIRPGGCYRHIDFRLVVSAPLRTSPSTRGPVRLGLVIDRSGSMSGGKLDTAKRAALGALDRLEPTDTVAVVVFDSEVDVIQRAAPATAALKERVRSELGKIEPRASTALHEGWLVGAKEIAGSESDPAHPSVSRVFLLTDGQANVGLVDPEAIASQAADIRATTGIGTSTFGIGADYHEGLLGPMAVAGGGQFHHLRHAGEIASTFVGELGDLLAVAAARVRLELDLPTDRTADVVSAFRAQGSVDGGARWAVDVGDLLDGEDRAVVIRFGFPRREGSGTIAVRSRATWQTNSVARHTEWIATEFSYADDRAGDAEPRDAVVMRHVGVEHAERVRRRATELSRAGDRKGAIDLIQRVAKRISAYAGSDPALLEAIRSLAELERELNEDALSPMQMKEMYSSSMTISRKQKDYRGGPRS
jgi:Ca-activated chloride channel family protein